MVLVPSSQNHLLLGILRQNVPLCNDAQYEGILAVRELARPIWNCNRTFKK